MSGYAVVDLETTGLYLSTDRIVEIGVVLVDVEGKPQEEFATLLDPQRDIGPSGVHGVRGSDVVGAPRFADVAEFVVAALRGRVVVAHNARFDLQFLDRELARLGMTLPESPYLCTMLAGARLFGVRSLSACCDVLGVVNEHAHSALSDARATAEVLRLALEDCEGAGLPGTGVVRSLGGGLAFDRLPVEVDRWATLHEVLGEPAGRFDAGCAARTRQAAAAQRTADRTYLADLVSRLPAVGSSPQMHSYLGLLDQALEDRLVTRDEAELLAAAAEHLGCSAAQVGHAHRLYLDALAGVALADGVLSAAEEADLQDVAQLLGLTGDDLSAALGLAGAGATVTLPTSERLDLPAGAIVVFTGAMSMGRDDLEDIARSAGWTPASNISKKTTLVIAADAQSQSGKARAAREKGIRIISEAVFHQLVAARRHQ